MKIQSTKDYSLFHSNPLQRSFKELKVARLCEKMKRNGFPASMTISVYMDKPGKYVINAGHHRLAAAKRLGLAVMYVVEHKWSITELSDEGSVDTRWAIKDHASNYAKGGNEDYIALLRLESMGLNIGQAASMLHGEQASSMNAAAYVKAGTFKIKTWKYVNQWLELNEEFGNRVTCLNHRVFISCYSKCLFTEEFDNQIFVKRLRKNPAMLERCNTEDQMLRLIEELYNHGSPKKIPLAFLVTSNSASRKASFGKV